MILSIIVAVGNNGVIGKDNTLIWHLPGDLQYFKNLTMGKPIIMGRKTFESIGKPLPGRTSVIVTHNKNYKAEGCIIAHTLEDALKKIDTKCEEAFIIGGAEIYKQSLPIADKIYMTRVYEDFEGDTFFPSINSSTWQLITKTPMPVDEKNKYPYGFLIFKKVKQ